MDARPHEVAQGCPEGRVENLDFLTCLLRTTAGVRVALESSRVAVGDQNNYGFEVRGTRGSVAWDFRRMGELLVSSGQDYQNQSTRLESAAPGDGAYGRFQPGAGISMGYDDLKVIECADLTGAVAGVRGTGTAATLDDAVVAAEVMTAMKDSLRTGAWTTPAAYTR
jgi:predicted dehydrogenase